MGRRIGVRDGRLEPCPDSPNCVSSQAGDDGHHTAPLRLAIDPSEALSVLRRVVEAMPRTRVVTCTDGYLHAECTSRIFGFVDDLELMLDAAAGVVHVRSASRTGWSDLGVNRRRVEEVRRAFAAAATEGP